MTKTVYDKKYQWQKITHDNDKQWRKDYAT